MKVSLHTISFRKIPLYPNLPEYDNQIKRFVAIVPVEELLNTNFPTETNPRCVNKKTGVARAIKSSLIDNPEFHILNRGIFLSAYSIKHFDEEKKLEIDLGEDHNVYGIIDGGHTYQIIKDTLSNRENPLNNRYVNVEIFTGFDSTNPENFIVQFADARNTSVPVNTSSLEELKGRFDFIKDRLKDKIYCKDIAFKQFDDEKVIDIREIICLMTLFDISTYKITDTSKEPNIAYSGKESCLERFKAECDREEKEKEQYRNIYKKINNILPEILDAADYIKSKIPYIWNKELGGNYKGLVFNKSINPKIYKGLTENDFLFRKEEALKDLCYKKNEDLLILIPRPFWLPILASLRVLVYEEDNVYKLKINFKKFFDDHSTELVGILKDTFNKTNLNNMGKDKIFWQNLHKEALLRAIQDGLIKFF